MKTPIRLLVVDDEARVRRGLEMRLALEPDIELVGQAGEADTALRLARELRPDIVVIDVLMPGLESLLAIRLLRATTPATSILAFSIRDDMTVRRDVLAAGATAFVAKQDGPDRLLAAIRATAHESAARSDTKH